MLRAEHTDRTIASGPLDRRADETRLKPILVQIVAARTVSLQITILKVLAGHPEGRARSADLARIVSILMSSGPDWTDRTKRLAAVAPQLDIFGRAFVLRDESGWQITDAGRHFLVSLEALAKPENDQGQQFEINLSQAPSTVIAQPLLRLVVDNVRDSNFEPKPDRTRRSA